MILRENQRQSKKSQRLKHPFKNQSLLLNKFRPLPKLRVQKSALLVKILKQVKRIKLIKEFPKPSPAPPRHPFLLPHLSSQEVATKEKSL
jgi:hypothetical protein